MLSFFCFLIIIYIFPIIISEKTLDTFQNQYPIVKKLKSNKFFIILSKNISIYNSDFTYNKTIYNFTTDEIINSNEDNEKTVISEYTDDQNNSYITFLTKGEYLFIYKEYQENLPIIKYKLNITNNVSSSKYYNLIPYKYNSYNSYNTTQYLISFISKEIKHTNKTEQGLFLYYYFRVKFLLYEINFSINTIENIYLNNSNHSIMYGLNYFTDYYLSCQIISNDKLLCFYKNNSKYLTAVLLNITDGNFTRIGLNPSSEISPYYIKSSLSKDKNKTFICYNDRRNTSKYIIYNNINNQFENVSGVQSFNKCIKSEIYYFNETDEYIFICQNKTNVFNVLRLNNTFKTINQTMVNLSKCSEINRFYVYYYDLYEDYGLINDCKNGNNEWNNIYNNSIFKEIQDFYFYFDQITKKEINKELIVENLEEIVSLVEIGKDYSIEGEDFVLVIKPTNSTYLEDSTHVNFTKCENILREKKNISDLRIITFLQLEISNNNEQSLVNKVEYQAYDDEKNLLDLSLCNDSNIQIFYSIKDSSSLDLDTISTFQDLGVDIFNINDLFFNDICHPCEIPDTISDDDIVLEDRIKDIYQNYSLCDEGCNYTEFNVTNMLISCDCKVKTSIDMNESALNIEQYDEIEIDSNFDLIKCYNLVFSLDNKLNNIGFWIFSILLLIHIPLLINILYKGIKPIEDYVFNEMVKNGYIKDKNNKLKKSKKNKKSKINSPPRNKKNKNNQDKITGIKLNQNSSINKEKISERDMINSINQNNLSNINKNNSDIKNLNDNIKKYNIKSEMTLKKKNTKTQGLKKAKTSLIFEKSAKKKNINILQTEVKSKKKLKTSPTENQNNEIVNFNIININLNNIKNDKPKSSHIILNNYTFEEASKYDLRSVLEIFYIFLLSKQEIFHAFLFRSPLELFPLRLCLLIFIMSSDLALNAFFYFDDNISKKYNYTRGLFLFTFSNNITIILLSTLIGFLFMTLFTNLSNSTNTIREIFKNEEVKLKKHKKYAVTKKRKKEILEEIKNILKKHKLKVIILLIIEFLLILFFWYYVTAFCHVYSNTQYSWLFDSFLSILSRFVIVLLFSLGFAKLYRLSVESNIHCIYKFVLFFYSFA